MHPHDVASLVADAVTRLRTVLDANPDLPVEEVQLRDDTQLFVRYSATVRDSAPFERARIANAAGQETALVFDVPILGSARARTYVLHVDCTNWDGDPPSVRLLDENEQPLADDQWPKDPERRGIVYGHPQFGPGPFFCRPGTLEFHTHPQHDDQPWDEFRPVTPLDQIVVELLRDLTSRWILG